MRRGRAGQGTRSFVVRNQSHPNTAPSTSGLLIPDPGRRSRTASMYICIHEYHEAEGARCARDTSRFESYIESFVARSRAYDDPRCFESRHIDVALARRCRTSRLTGNAREIYASDNKRCRRDAKQGRKAQIRQRSEKGGGQNEL